MNGDDYGDVLIGSYNYDHPEINEGIALVFLGSAAGIAADPDWVGECDQAGAHLADKLSTAGDVNGDGYDDVILGAADYDANGFVDGGGAFLYLGTPSGLAEAPAWSKSGDQNGGRFGACVSAAGDVNGDGYHDVIVGAWLWDDGEIDEGKAFLYLGSESGLAETPAWTGQSDSQGAVYAYRATTAGDLNGDGFSDIVVGARRYSGDGIYADGTLVAHDRVESVFRTAGHLVLGAHVRTRPTDDRRRLGAPCRSARAGGSRARHVHRAMGRALPTG